MLTKKTIKHNNKPTILAILNGLFESGRLLTGAFHTLYYLQQGITLKQVAYIQIAFSLTVLLSELPTGYFADHYSRKYATVSACFLIAVFYPICYYFPFFKVLIFAHIIYAIGMSFFSGSAFAWVVEVITSQNQDTNKIDYYSHLSREIANCGTMITGIITTLIVILMGFQFVFIFSSFTMLTLAVTYLFISNPQQNACEQTCKSSNFFSSLQNTLFTSKEGMTFLCVSCVIVAMYQPLYHYWQPLFLSISTTPINNDLFSNKNIIMLGVIFSLTSAIIMLSHYIVRKHLAKLHPFSLAIRLSIITAALFLLLGNIPSGHTIAFVLIYSLLHGHLSILYTTTTNVFAKNAKINVLSSLLSVRSVLQRLAAICVLSMISWQLNFLSLKGMVSIFSFFAILTAILFYVWPNEYVFKSEDKELLTINE